MVSTRKEKLEKDRFQFKQIGSNLFITEKLKVCCSAGSSLGHDQICTMSTDCAFTPVFKHCPGRRLVRDWSSSEHLCVASKRKVSEILSPPIDFSREQMQTQHEMMCTGQRNICKTPTKINKDTHIHTLKKVMANRWQPVSLILTYLYPYACTRTHTHWWWQNNHRKHLSSTLFHSPEQLYV